MRCHQRSHEKMRVAACCVLVANRLSAIPRNDSLTRARGTHRMLGAERTRSSGDTRCTVKRTPPRLRAASTTRCNNSSAASGASGCSANRTCTTGDGASRAAPTTSTPDQATAAHSELPDFCCVMVIEACRDHCMICADFALAGASGYATVAV